MNIIHHKYHVPYINTSYIMHPFPKSLNFLIKTCRFYLPINFTMVKIVNLQTDGQKDKE